MLLAAPKILQAGLAALGDFFTWKIAIYIYGPQSTASLSTLLLTIASPWQWFCSTRTFSNSLETTLTVIGLYNWPWHWAVPFRPDGAQNTYVDKQHGVRTRKEMTPNTKPTDEITRLRRSLLCAAVAVILRPTNIFIWMVLSWYTFIANWSAPAAEIKLLIREIICCGSAVLLLSTVTDRIFYDAWVFPPLNFLRVNVLQSLASFYGNNDWHYYVSQGYPLLLMTALPFTLLGFRRIMGSPVKEVTPVGERALLVLSRISIIVPTAFSFISHKEVRFIYPLLPAFHIISALPLAEFFKPFLTNTSTPSPMTKRLLLLFLLSLNIGVSYYTSQIHNSGIISLADYLRDEFEGHYVPSSSSIGRTNMTFGMFMPCHSTPWRSHLQHPPSSTQPGIQGWALTCEPPVHITNATEKAAYLDEADQFYANPTHWIKKHMSRQLPLSSFPGVHVPRGRSGGGIETIPAEILAHERAMHFWATGEGRKPWPEYLVFFEQLEPTMQVALRGSAYGECRRLFNSHFHDDWRRTGDIVVWCLDHGRQEGWRTMKGKPKHRNEKEVGEEVDMQEEASTEGLGQKILGGGKANPKTNAKKKGEEKESFRRVVEKPFWKHRDPDED